MGHWADRLIYVRDFAFTQAARRSRMANAADIADTNANDFAEYVAGFPLPTDRIEFLAKLARLLSGPNVDAFVGPARRRWTLHANLLCHHSEPLATQLLGDQSPDALSSNGHSPSLGSPPETPLILELPDEDPAGFELLVKWLYQGKLDSVSRLANDEQKYDYAVACHKLYLLCERFDLRPLKNQAIDEYRKGLSEAGLVPDASELNDIYRASPAGSLFRKLMVKIAARQIMDPDSERGADQYRACFEDPDFAVELVDAIKQGTGGLLFEDPTEGASCSWHDHSNGGSCNTRTRHKQGK